MERESLPDVGGLIGELCGHQGEVLPHLDPQVGLGDAAVVRMDGMDPSHLPGYQPESRTEPMNRLEISPDKENNWLMMRS